MGAAKQAEMQPAKKLYRGRKVTKIPARPVESAPVKKKTTEAEESPSKG